MEKIDFRGSLSETLLINLYMRHLDSLLEKPILGDRHASAVVKQIDYDFEKFDKSDMTRVGASIRARFIDEAILELAKEGGELVVVQVGAGLDTRPLRLCEKLPQAVFYDLDLPAVMELRERLIPRNERMFSFRASMFEEGWIKELCKKHAGANFAFVLEGIVMYFEPSEVQALFSKLGANFRGIIACDLMSEQAPKVFKKEKHDSLKYIPGELKVYGSKPEALGSERVRLVRAENMMELHKSYWSLKARFLSLIPLFRHISKLCVYKIG